MARYALADGDGLVHNVIVWDGVRYDEHEAPCGWTPPDDLKLIELADTGGVGPGDTIDAKGNVLEAAPVPEPEPTLEARIAALEVNEVLTSPAKAVD